MATKSKPARQADLRNEGQALPVGVTPTNDGRATYQVDLTGVLAPLDVFTADGVAIKQSDDGYRIAFTMSKHFGEGVRALVEILISDVAAKSFSHSLDQLNRKEGRSSDLVTVSEDPEDSVSFVANFVRISSNEFGSVMDFYFVSPLSMEQAGKTGVLHYKALVRISTTSLVFFAVVKYFLPLKDQAHESV